MCRLLAIQNRGDSRTRWITQLLENHYFSRPFFRIDFLKVFPSFLHPFWNDFLMLLHTFYIPFSSSIFGCFFLYFCLISLIFFFGQILADTYSTRGFIWLPYIHPFRKRRWSLKHMSIFSFIFVLNFHHYSSCFRNRYSHRFS